MKSKLRYLLYILMISNHLFSQTEIFKTKISISQTELSNFLSSVYADNTALYFVANDYKLYKIDKKSNQIQFTTEINSKSNDRVFVVKDTLISSFYENKKQSAVFIDKNSGIIIKKLNVCPLKSNPFFINETKFISTIIDDNGGHLICYDLKSNQILWKHFVGHGVSKKIYRQNESILANFDFNEWKKVDYNGKIEEEIFEVDQSNNKMQLHHEFYVLTHDNIEINQEFLSNYFLNTENLKVNTNETNTVLLNQTKIVVLADNAKVISNKELSKIIHLPDEGENDYLEILKIETENVWFFYQNLIVNYDFQKNKVVKTYDLTPWNAHQIILDSNTLWLVSKNDGQLYGLHLEETKESLDKKTAIAKKEKEQGYSKPDKAKIEAEKAAKEKYKHTTKTK
jgi:hypothetical protein